VTYASLVGGKVKNPTRQETANANNIKKLCEEGLGVPSVSLITANGLPVEDSEGTRSLSVSV